jgi:transcriptional regulator with XRE-family HTH domain
VSAAISPKKAKQLLEQNFQNATKRLKKNQPLTRDELRMLDRVAAGDAEGNTGPRFVRRQEDLAEAIGLTRKTVSRWLKLDGVPQTAADGRYDVDEWLRFKAKRRGMGDDGTGKPEDDAEELNLPVLKAKNLLKQNEKLELQTAILRREYVPIELVQRWGSELGSRVRSIILSLHTEAQSLIGVSAIEAEARLKRKEDEIIQEMHLLAQKIEREMEERIEEGAGEENHRE